MAAVGIDIGFGFTKAYNGRDTIAFKSIFGDATDIQYREQLLGTPRAEEHLHVATGGNGYFVGELAERQSNVRSFTLDQDHLISTFARLMAITAQKLTGVKIEPYRHYGAIDRGSIKIRGKTIDLKPLIEEGFSKLASSIAAEIDRLWADDWDIDLIVITGGGGAALAPYLTPALNGEVMALDANADARLNNVRGYWKYGMNVWGKELRAASAS